MKFVHIADMHFDVPFTTLNKKELGNIRRLDQRKALKKVIDYIKQNNIPYLFISGDLYEHEYVKQSTIEYINNLFKEIENTKIYIVPGNHDPLLKNSYYSKFNWNKNVHIFSSNIEKISENGIDIYGFGFDNFYMKESKYQEIQIENKEKINILITHGSLEGGTSADMEYNPMNKTKLNNLGFDYIALGHIHKTNCNEETKIIYPGSTISLGFDELGSHGMIVGEIDESTKALNMQFIKIDEKEFIEYELDISELQTKEELIEKINLIEIEEDKYYKIILIGNRQFEINIYDIEKYIQNNNIIKIKDHTKIKYDLEKMALGNNLKGIFVKELLQKIEENPEEKEVYLKAIEIGLEAM